MAVRITANHMQRMLTASDHLGLQTISQLTECKVGNDDVDDNTASHGPLMT